MSCFFHHPPNGLLILVLQIVWCCFPMCELDESAQRGILSHPRISEIISHGSKFCYAASTISHTQVAAHLLSYCKSENSILLQVLLDITCLIFQSHESFYSKQTRCG